jgi:hypothetical protein
VRNAMRDREVQRRAVDAGLSAGDDGEGYGQLIAKVTNPDIEPKAFRPANLVNRSNVRSTMAKPRDTPPGTRGRYRAKRRPSFAWQETSASVSFPDS